MYIGSFVKAHSIWSVCMLEDRSELGLDWGKMKLCGCGVACGPCSSSLLTLRQPHPANPQVRQLVLLKGPRITGLAGLSRCPPTFALPFHRDGLHSLLILTLPSAVA
jgi:hypothetical protein